MRKHLLFFLHFITMLFAVTPAEGRESVYLHLDNDAYFLGDTIWFSAYITNDACLGSNSKVLYVELLSPEGNIVNKQCFRVVGGRSYGEIPLPIQILSGFFEVRAYTKYMMNWGKDNYYSRVIPVMDSSHVGDYSSYTMLDRERKGVIEKDVPTPNSVPIPTGTDNVFSVSYDSASVVPFGMIELQVKGLPQTTFSISITDLDTKFRRTHELTVCDYIANELQTHDDAVKIRFQPEQGITTHGILYKRKRRFFKKDKKIRMANMPMKARIVDDYETADRDFRSDERGEFHLCLGDVFGKNILKISYNPMLADENTYIHTSREQLQPRKYLKWEEELPQLCEGTTDINGTILKNIDVKGHHSNNKWKPVSMSHLRLDIDEELEDMLNQGLKDDKIVGCLSILKKYKYPALPTRLVEAIDNNYVDSVIPHPLRISDGLWSSSTFKRLSSYKEMIIRTDKPTCYAYSYSERPIYSPPLLSSRNGGTVVDGGWYVDMPSKPSKTTGMLKMNLCPSIVAFLIPKTTEELSSPYQAWNSHRHIRYTHILGFQKPSVFRNKDYSVSHPVSDLRRTLYWNPCCRTDREGKASIKFYNNSSCHRISVSIEGVTPEGEVVIYK